MSVGLIVTIFGVALVCAALTVVSNRLYIQGVARQRKPFLNDNPDLAAANLQAAADRAWLAEQPLEDLQIHSADGLCLRAYYLPANPPGRETAILAHGYTSQGKELADFCRFFTEQLGYNVLMPDDRGHGQSEGNYIGMGWPDRKDYLLWIEAVLSKTGPQTPIVLFGVSMGGATVLMLSGEALPPNVRVIISDCAYTSVKDEFSYHLKRMYRLPPFPLISLSSLVCKLRAGYYFGEASALRQVKKARVPILFIHGAADHFVPTEMVYPLYESCPTPKELFVVPGARHAASYTVDRPGYQAKVSAFLEKYAPRSQPEGKMVQAVRESNAALANGGYQAKA
jgi:fermentation-respiration switch protein FrsA (DUF1100 family)